jgi:hypothetical protein
LNAHGIVTTLDRCVCRNRHLFMAAKSFGFRVKKYVEVQGHRIAQLFDMTGYHASHSIETKLLYQSGCS